MVGLWFSCCGTTYGAYTYYHGVFRRMGGNTSWLTYSSTAGGGSTLFDCLRPGVVEQYGYEPIKQGRMLHVGRTLYVSHGVTWRLWKTSQYNVSINSPLGPTVPSRHVSPVSRCR